MSNMSDHIYQNLKKSNFGDTPGCFPGAIPTDSGWVNPKTKEVLFLSRGLLTRIVEYKQEAVRRGDLAQKDYVEWFNAVVTGQTPHVVEKAPVVVEKASEPEPVKRGRGRPAGSKDKAPRKKKEEQKEQDDAGTAD